MVTKERIEDYGDVVMPYCDRLNQWLDFYEDLGEPCNEDYYTN